jgi:type II secretory pathway component PulF
MSLENTLDGVIAARSTIANVLQDNAAVFVGPQRWRLKQLSRFFSNPNLNANDLVHHPEALAVCLPLLKTLQSPEAETSLHKAQSGEHIASAIRVGIERAILATTTTRWGHLIAYPLTMVMLSLALLVFFSFNVIPIFERMFDEFGLDLPAVTSFVILLSHWAQAGWWIVLVVFVAFILGLIVLRLNGNFDSSSRYKFGAIEKWCTSTRAAWADWALHVAMLTEAGVTQPDAVEIAGRSSPKAWLARFSRAWSNELRSGNQHFQSLSHVDGKSVNTLAYAIRLPSSVDRAAVLYDVAANYREWDASRTYWWLDWVNPLTVTGIAFGVGTMLVSLFLPLISLISGLT